MKQAKYLWVPLAVIAQTAAVWACSCLPPGKPKAELKEADAVFSGKVLSVEKKHNAARVRFEVERTWKGLADSKNLTIATASNSAACGYNFEKSKRYLVYAHWSADAKSFSTNLCERTTRLDQAGADLKELGAGTAIGKKAVTKIKTSPKKFVRPGGLVIEELRVGRGQIAKKNDRITVHYKGFLTNGKQFDESYKRGEPFEFILGSGEVIKGWDEGLVGMKVGGKRKLTIPSPMGYGERGAGEDIPPNATLVFLVELIKIGK